MILSLLPLCLSEETAQCSPQQKDLRTRPAYLVINLAQLRLQSSWQGEFNSQSGRSVSFMLGEDAVLLHFDEDGVCGLHGVAFLVGVNNVGSGSGVSEEGVERQLGDSG